MRLPVLPAPSQLVQHLPRLLLKPAGRAPFILQRLVLESALRQVFAEAIQDGEFEFLRGKYLKVEIRDMNLDWYFTFNGRQLALARQGRADASISGDLREFILLASRGEDPDTLFFQRRLHISGDTALGLEVKNMLDTIDLDRLPRPIITCLQRFAGRWG